MRRAVPSLMSTPEQHDSNAYAASERTQNPDGQRLLLTISGAVAFAWIASLGLMLAGGHWIVDVHGKPLVIDFLEVWVAGKFALHGAAAAPYDPIVHHAAQVAAIGHPFAGFLGWHYPPLFLFAAAALACLPYAAAFLGWIAATFAAYAIILWTIARRWEAAVLALASPFALANLIAGQNGFFSGALAGGALLFMEERPIVSGVFIGLLTYKPQLGLLFPIALLAGRQWRALASAAATALAVTAVSILVFGVDAMRAFLHFLPITGHAILADGSAGWSKLQTVYGLSRWLGSGDAGAWAAQGTIALAAAAAVAWLWNSNKPFNMKAAGLSAGLLLATPYLYAYDLPMLAIPLAFLFRERAFNRVEWIAIAALNLAMIPFLWTAIPAGPFLVSIVCILIARRLLVAHRAKRARPGDDEAGNASDSVTAAAPAPSRA